MRVSSVAGEESPVIIVDQGIKPRVSLQSLIAVIDFPGVFAPSLSESNAGAPGLILRGRRRVIHVFACQLDGKLSRVARAGGKFVGE